MYQKFFTKTIESKFIKNLLYNTPLPYYKSVKSGDYIVSGIYYIYGEHVIKCTDSGMVNTEQYTWNAYTLAPSIETEQNEKLINVVKTYAFYTTDITETKREKHYKLLTADTYETEISGETVEQHMPFLVTSDSDVCTLLYSKAVSVESKTDTIVMDSPQEFEIDSGTTLIEAKVKLNGRYIYNQNEKKIQYVHQVTKVMKGFVYAVVSDLGYTNSSTIVKTEVSNTPGQFPTDGKLDIYWYKLVETLPQAEYDIITDYHLGEDYPHFTEKYISEFGYYDSGTHEQLGRYLRLIRDLRDIDLMPLYNCYSGRAAANFHIKTNHAYNTATYGYITLPSGRMLGDVNGDGVVDEEDVQIADSIVKGLYTPTDEEKWCASVTNNTTVTDEDVVLLSDGSYLEMPYHFSQLATSPFAHKELKTPFCDDNYQYIINYTSTQNKLYRTSDFKTWEKISDSFDYDNVFFVNDTYVLQKGTEIYFTDDLSEITTKIDVTFTGALQYVNKKFIAFGTSDETQSKVWVSDDGSTWEEKTLPTASVYYNRTILSNGTQYLFLYTKNNKVYSVTTEDFETWSDPVKTSINGTLSDTVKSIYFDRKYFIFGLSGPEKETSFYTSTDGNSWTEHALAVGSRSLHYPIIYAFGTRLVIGFKDDKNSSHNIYFTTTDGTTLAQYYMPKTQKWDLILGFKTTLAFIPQNAASNPIFYSSDVTKDYLQNWGYDSGLMLWFTDITTWIRAEDILSSTIGFDGIIAADNLSDTVRRIYCETPVLTPVKFEVGQRKPVYELVNTTNSDYKVMQIPIKFNQTYTIAMDTAAEALILPAVIYNGRFVSVYTKEKNKLDLTEVLNKKAILKNGCNFRKPFTYKLDLRDIGSSIAGGSVSDAFYLETNEKNLYLLIQVPVSDNSSLVVLEGEYKNNYQIMKYYDHDSIADLSIEQKNALFLSALSLLKLNDHNNYAFSDRLIEYLTLNVISPMDELDENIKRVQDAHQLEGYSDLTYGFWSDTIRSYYFDIMMNNKKIEHYDLMGYIDRDTEKYGV